MTDRKTFIRVVSDMYCSRKMPDGLVLAIQEFRDHTDRNTLLVLCHHMGRIAELMVTGGGQLALRLLARDYMYQKSGKIK